MKRAIVTGATGALGTALLQELISNGTEVLVFCRGGSKNNARIPEHKQITKKECALSQLAEVQNETGKSYDVFYHFGWEGTTGAAREDLYLQNRNVRYALDAVAAAKRFGCHTFVGAGSQAEYGRVSSALKADTPAFPETGYGMGKLCAGQMTREYAHQLGLRHIWTRILSVYGPYDNPQSMIMSVIRQLERGEAPALTRGEQIWDYLYSADAAKAFWLLGEKGVDGKTYVVGSGKARPLAAYIQEIREILSPQTELSFGAVPYGKKQVMYLKADPAELQRDTGFLPETEFRDGIKAIIEWRRKNGML